MSKKERVIEKVLSHIDLQHKRGNTYNALRWIVIAGKLRGTIIFVK